MRMALLAILFMGVQTAAAQDTPLSRATAELTANWRPVTTLSSTAFDASCAGAQEELNAIDAALPRVLTQETLARVRALRGLAIVPADDVPGAVYVFAPPTLNWLTSGLATVHLLDESEGFIRLTDAAGLQVALQRGAAGGRPVLRLRAPDNTILNFVGCVPIE